MKGKLSRYKVPLIILLAVLILGLAGGIVYASTGKSKSTQCNKNAEGCDTSGCSGTCDGTYNKDCTGDCSESPACVEECAGNCEQQGTQTGTQECGPGVCGISGDQTKAQTESQNCGGSCRR